jgi:hypothetical protein
MRQASHTFEHAPLMRDAARKRARPSHALDANYAEQLATS